MLLGQRDRDLTADPGGGVDRDRHPLGTPEIPCLNRDGAHLASVAAVRQSRDGYSAAFEAEDGGAPDNRVETRP